MNNSNDFDSLLETKPLDDCNDNPIEYEDVIFYAKLIGIDPISEPELLWIANIGLLSSLPSGWIAVEDRKGRLYYYDRKTNQSSWEHPKDFYYRKLVKLYRQSYSRLSSGSIGTISSQQSWFDCDYGRNNLETNNSETSPINIMSEFGNLSSLSNLYFLDDEDDDDVEKRAKKNSNQITIEKNLKKFMNIENDRLFAKQSTVTKIDGKESNRLIPIADGKQNNINQSNTFDHSIRLFGQQERKKWPHQLAPIVRDVTTTTSTSMIRSDSVTIPSVLSIENDQKHRNDSIESVEFDIENDNEIVEEVETDTEMNEIIEIVEEESEEKRDKLDDGDGDGDDGSGDEDEDDDDDRSQSRKRIDQFSRNESSSLDQDQDKKTMKTDEKIHPEDEDEDESFSNQNGMKKN
ncbi:Centrosomal protein [Sarcoptes scabiei]|uniref:Centrosomal protein n=1 Tax=Sarcoptes scabiei TaxID=52283 RepID=A0A834RI22_SARSC|nr:Centrosomal protein [Sarcoptes scabiei]